jgi:hypothetical protein
MEEDKDGWMKKGWTDEEKDRLKKEGYMEEDSGTDEGICR